MLSSPPHDVFLLMSLTPSLASQTSWCQLPPQPHTQVSPAPGCFFMLSTRSPGLVLGRVLEGQFLLRALEPVPGGGAQVPGQSLRFLQETGEHCSRVHMPWWCGLGEAQGIRAASKWGTHPLSVPQLCSGGLWLPQLWASSILACVCKSVRVCGDGSGRMSWAAHCR